MQTPSPVSARTECVCCRSRFTFQRSPSFWRSFCRRSRRRLADFPLLSRFRLGVRIEAEIPDVEAHFLVLEDFCENVLPRRKGLAERKSKNAFGNFPPL